jgi:hypothetical protein
MISTPFPSPHRSGSETHQLCLPHSMQVHIQSSLACPPSVFPQCSKHNSGNPCTFSEDGSALFSFTHRRANGVQWGLVVTCDEHQRALIVNDVQPGGAIDSWNRQVLGGPKADKVLKAGDLIVSINSKRSCKAMMDEHSSMLWKIEVVRRKCE